MRIHRRELLGLCSGGIVAFSAGCLRLSGDGSGDGEESESATTTESGADSDVTNRIQIVSSVGVDIEDNSIPTVRLTVKRAPDAGDIDLSATTLQFVSSAGSVDLTYGSYEGSGSNTEFGVTAVQDEDGSIGSDGVVLNDAADRATLVLDTSSIVPSTDGLTEGDTATVQINTQSGGSTEVRLVVPETLSGADAVNL